MSNGGIIGPSNAPSSSIGYLGVRYVRVYAAGSTTNTSTHFVEVQVNTAINGGTNRALNLGSSGAVSQYTGGTPEQTMNTTTWQVVTNGNTASTDYIGFGASNAGIQLDLGAIYYDIAEVRFWNYYADGRTYYNVTVFVSSDNVNWTTLYGPTNTATVAAGISVPNLTIPVTSGLWRPEEQYYSIVSDTWSGVPVRSNRALELDTATTYSYPGSGTAWYDTSGNARNATLVSSPTYAGTSPSYFTFVGGTSYATLPNAFGVGTGTVTVEAWVYLNSMTTNNLLFASQSSNVAGFYALGVNNASGWLFGTYDGTNRPTRYFPTVPSLNTWYHVVGLRDSTSNLMIYVNGVPTTSAAVSTTLSLTSSDCRIGINPASSGEYWNGRVSLLRVYTSALSATQVQRNFNATRSRYGV